MRVIFWIWKPWAITWIIIWTIALAIPFKFYNMFFLYPTTKLVLNLLVFSGGFNNKLLDSMVTVYIFLCPAIHLFLFVYGWSLFQGISMLDILPSEYPFMIRMLRFDLQLTIFLTISVVVLALVLTIPFARQFLFGIASSFTKAYIRILIKLFSFFGYSTLDFEQYLNGSEQLQLAEYTKATRVQEILEQYFVPAFPNIHKTISDETLNNEVKQDIEMQDLQNSPLENEATDLQNETMTRPTGSNDENIDQQENCSICLESFDETCIRTVDCHHTFHRDCIEQWLKSATIPDCPLCKEQFLPKVVVVE